MLKEHGKSVDIFTCNNWDLATHNNSIRLKHQLATYEWESLLEKHRAGNIPPKLSQSVTAISVPNKTYIFEWPAWETRVAVICTNPACTFTFTKHPLKCGRAVNHFRTHGLELHVSQVLQLFGFRSTYLRCI
ncbi:hypothetical protein F4803DRAFT_539348 [Xylaria telfairii]|nr:hypothetical protein F4803DRAFT_539348 [Xylaria telfairii]